SLFPSTTLFRSMDDHSLTLFSENYACDDCGVSMPELSPRMFSFNNPYGACPACTGLGMQLVADEDLIIPDKEKSLAQGAIQVIDRKSTRLNSSHVSISYAVF